MIKPIALVFFALTGACASTSAELEPPKVPKPPLQGVIAEFNFRSFDGERLQGRLLLGTTVETFKVDGRLSEWIDVELRKVRACDTKDLLEHYLPDRILPPIRQDEIITIRPGYWYGSDINFLLFAKGKTPGLPDCFEADLMAWSLDGRLAVTHAIRVTRTDKPSAPPASSPPGETPLSPP